MYTVLQSLYRHQPGLLHDAADVTQKVEATSPGTRNVFWAPLPTLHDSTLPPKEQVVQSGQVLIDGAASKCAGWICSESDRGLKEPVGLALFQKGGGNAWLYVSDPKVGFLYRYEVSLTWRKTLEAGPQEVVARDLKDSAHWLAVDGFGNLFYTDAEAGSISMIAAEDVSKGLSGAGRTLLSSETLSQVASPAGLAADATALYWANLKGDQSTGTLLRSTVSPLSLANKTSKKAMNSSAAMALAGRQMAGRHYVFQAAVKDICLAGTNVFFTGDGKSLFAVKADGSSDVTEVASLKQPKGCTYDQETTVFVADQSLNGIYSLPANMQKLRQAKHVRKVVSLKGPQQIAIFYGPSSNKFLQPST
eukprot:s2036_g8.t1